MNPKNNIFQRIRSIEDVDMDQWKMCYAAFFVNNGSVANAYSWLSSNPEFNKGITKKIFRALVEDGVKSKGLPGIMALYIANVKKQIAEQGIKTQQYVDRTVELSGRYLEAINIKISDMMVAPESMSKNIGGELDKVFGIFQKYNELMKQDKSARIDITLDQAFQIKSDSSNALKRISQLESRDDDYGLDAKMK